jgi:non-homologous end joining protein Ku
MTGSPRCRCGPAPVDLMEALRRSVGEKKRGAHPRAASRKRAPPSRRRKKAA